jgi:uncharacterized protein (DUF58 family)
MLTLRGWFFFLGNLGLLTVGVLADIVSLALVCLTLLLWFLAAWLQFALRVRLISRRLRVQRELWDARGPVTSLWAQARFGVLVRLHNDSLLAKPYLRVRDRVPFGIQLVSGVTATDGLPTSAQPLTLRYDIFCPAPGLVRFDGLAVQIADLQGFFLHRCFVRNTQIYRVLPPLADVEGRIPVPKRHNLLPLLGTHRLRRPGTGSELLDLRDYLPGDPPKTIAWKASARRDRLMTKEFESEIPVRCTLFVDASNSVRVGPVGNNALTRLVEITAAAAQACMGNRDLVGLCVFDEGTTRILPPARSSRQLIQIFNVLAEAAALAPASGLATVDSLLPLAYALAQEVYPEWLEADVNYFPWWLPWLSPQPAYNLPTPPIRARSWLGWPLALLRRDFRQFRLGLRQLILARLSSRHRTRYRWRKQLAALLSVRYGLAPGGLALLLEDDEQIARYLQRFLAEHQVPYELPFYSSQGRYLFAAAEKVEVSASALLRAVRRGRDNELFVLLADVLEIVEHLGPLLAAVKVARARHHQVVLVCPWPPSVPLPSRGRLAAATPPAPGLARSAFQQRIALRAATALRFDRAFHQVRGTFARLGVPVVCAGHKDAVPLILSRLERLRVQERGVR